MIVASHTVPEQQNVGLKMVWGKTGKKAFRFFSFQIVVNFQPKSLFPYLFFCFCVKDDDAFFFVFSPFFLSSSSKQLFFREYFRLYLDAKKSDAVVFVHRITTRKKVDAKMRAKIAFECESH